MARITFISARKGARYEIEIMLCYIYTPYQRARGLLVYIYQFGRCHLSSYYQILKFIMSSTLFFFLFLVGQKFTWSFFFFFFCRRIAVWSMHVIYIWKANAALYKDRVLLYQRKFFFFALFGTCILISFLDFLNNNLSYFIAFLFNLPRLTWAQNDISLPFCVVLSFPNYRLFRNIRVESPKNL